MPRRNKTPRLPRYQAANNQCGSKVAYRSKSEAKRVIDDRLQLLDDEVELDSYRCPSCQAWHLTSSRGK